MHAWLLLPTICLSLWAQMAPPGAVSTGAKLTETVLRGHLMFLADEMLEGRGLGQRGGQLAVRYLESQLRIYGLQAPCKGSYRQEVKLLGTRTLSARTKLHFITPNGPVPLALGQDFAVNAAIAKTRQDFDVPLIFVGYGIQNRDEHWDDFKGLDLHGKLLLALAGEPGQTDKEPGRFEGASLTYQARPSYKFEEARKRGALGVLLVHTEAGAGSGWDAIRPAWVGERFRLAKDEGLALEGWISEEGAKMILKAASLDLRALQAKAENRDFKPVKVPVRMKGILNSEARRITESNVAGLVLGTDAQLKDDLIIYSSHWDHLGIHRDEKGQTIYPGARDNATGISALLAMSEFAAQHPMKRSQLFLFTCGEEQGLLGAFAYTQDPLFPLERTAACINMDTLNVLGATRDLGAFGAEHSDLADLSAQAAKIIGVLLRPPQPDPWGGFFRMDHFPFVKVGVPSISVTGGYDYVKDPEGTRKKAQAYGRWYHQASDRYDPTWNLSGALQQAEFALELGRRISEAPALPTWKPGDPYGVLRKK